MNPYMKQDIIYAYYELVTEHGIENTSLSKVAKKIGINTSLIFHYFKNKDELISCFFDYVLSESRSFFILPESKNDNVALQFEEYIDNIICNLKYTQMDTKAYYTCYILALRNEAYKKRFIEHRELLSKIYIENLQYFKDHGVIDPVDMKFAANYMEIISDGIANMRDFITDSSEDLNIIEYYKQQLKAALNYQR